MICFFCQTEASASLLTGKYMCSNCLLTGRLQFEESESGIMDLTISLPQGHFSIISFEPLGSSEAYKQAARLMIFRIMEQVRQAAVRASDSSLS